MYRFHSPFLIFVTTLGGCAVSAPREHLDLPTIPSGSGSAGAGDRSSPIESSAIANAARQKSDDLLHAGDVEVLVAGTGGNDEDFEVGSGALGIALNVYINDHGTAAMVRQGVSFSDPGPGSDNWDGSSRLGIQQTFETGGPVMPFVGASLGRVYGDTVEESWTGGPEAGLKWYLKPEAFLSLGVEYQFLFDSEDRIGDVAEDGNFIYLIGFGMKF